MKTFAIGGGTLVLLGLATAVAGRGVEAPKAPEGVAKARRALAEAYRYKGTTVTAARGLRAAEADVARARALLSRADFVPAARRQRFARLNRNMIVVGWHLTIEALDVRRADALVRVRAAPLLRAPGEGIIGVFSFYHETYRVADGKLQFLGGEPLPDDPSINISVQ